MITKGADHYLQPTFLDDGLPSLYDVLRQKECATNFCPQNVTNDVTVAVWVGYDNSGRTRRTLGHGATGSHVGRYQPGWYSVDVPNTGTTIRVVSVDKKKVMTVKVGTKR